MSVEPSAERSDHYCLEIACFDAESLLRADGAGADRTEFCADRSVGGVTPIIDEVLRMLPLVRGPVRVMIRPRGGDFVYSDAEFDRMKKDINALKQESVIVLGKLDGFVFGILDVDHRLDVPRNSELVALAAPLSCALHRAFDDVADLDGGLEDAIACGFKTILTSGGAMDAAIGAEVLCRLVKKAGERITIMPGGGVRSSNAGLLRDKTKAAWYHSSAMVGDEINLGEILALKESINDIN